MGYGLALKVVACRVWGSRGWGLDLRLFRANPKV